MNFDFSALLLLLSVISGLIWAADAWIFAPRRAAREPQPAEDTETTEESAPSPAPQEPLLVEYARSFFPIFVIVLILRAFIVEPFRIPSASMMPTLLIGDFILVNKYDYGIRLPLTDTKIISYKEPQRGDIIVFRYPEDPSIPYIKRVIGVPGDHIEYRNKIVYINGKEMPQKVLGTYYTDGTGLNSWLQENLGTVKHEILENPYRNLHNNVEGITVPKGEYFVMGDNRDNSEDSRYWGFVPEKNLIGKAFLIWMNWRFKEIWDIPSWSAKFNRIGTVLH